MKRILSAILILSLMIGFAPTMLPAAQAENKYPADAIPISSVEELMLICNEYPANGDYYLTTDIDLTARTSEGGDLYNDGAGWLPIGTAGTPFTGTFDGDGHSIIGLYINRSNSDYVGFFGDADGATIQNLSIENGNVKGKTYVGILAGRAGQISNCVVSSGSVSASGNAGGIAGTVEWIEDSSNYASVKVNYGSLYNITTFSTSIGGVSGSGSASSCNNHGSIEVTGSASTTVTKTISLAIGGVIGSATGPVDNLKNDGPITETFSITSHGNYVPQGSNWNKYIGGIVGYTETSITSSQNHGEISATGASFNDVMKSCFGTTTRAGGIAGFTSQAIQNCENNSKVSVGSDYSAKACGIGTATVIQYCRNSGQIIGGGNYYGYAYGIGYVHNESATAYIDCCFNLGELSSQTEWHNNGYHHYGNSWAIGDSTTIKNCYNSSDSVLKLGAATTFENCYNKNGIIWTSGSAISCYYYASEASGIGELRTLQQLQQRSTYVAWDFDNIWTMDGNPDYFYPELRNAPANTWQKSVTGIELVSGPDKTEYLEGKDDLDLTGAKIKATYDNGTTEILDVTEDMVSGFDKYAVGTLTITVTYGGYTTTFTVTVIAKSLVSIAVTTLPLKLTYLEGKDALSVEGGVLTLYYNNDTTAERVMELYMVRGFDNTVPGVQTLTVTYYGKSTTYDVEIIAKSLSAISMLQLPTKTTYYEGEAFDPTGGKVKLIYNNDTTGEVALTSDMVSGYHPDQLGSQTLTVTYSGKTTTFEINVLAKQVSSIEIDTLPTKRVYLEGKDQLDVTGGKIRVYYNNNTQELLDMLPEMVSGFDNTVVGTQTLTVTYGGKSTTYQIQVIAKTLIQVQIYSLPYKLTYLVNKDTLNLAGGKLKLVYNNDTFDVIDMTLDMASGFNNTVVGTQWITITYQSFSVQFEIQILDKSAVSISIVSLPSKLTYFEGDELSVAGGKIKVYYNNDETQTLDMTPSMISGFDSSSVGTKTVTITYMGVSTYYVVEVTHDFQDAITPPTCTEQGYTTHTCSRCGNSYVDNYVGALGHAWDEGVIIQEPTETEPGLRRYTCTRCGATRDEVIPSPGHEHHYTAVVTPPTCTEQGYTTYTCSCGDSYVDDYVPALGHAFGDWTMTTPPTCEGAGAETRTCSRCGETESSPVPALGHDWGEPEYVWADDNSYVTASRSCKREAGHMEMETVLTSSQIIKEPTYEEEGLTVFIAVFTNTAFQTQTKSTALPKLIRENPFVDVIEGKYYYKPVLWAYYHQPYQITGGTDATHFSPNKTCTREQVVSFLYAAYDKPEHHMTTNPFTDVKAGKYYYNAVMWAVENKITGGATETTFGIGKPCTREQVVTFLWKAAGAPAPKSTANPFTDVKAGKYYYNAVLWAVENGITGGATETTFGVGKPCTRAQVVTFLYKAVGEG